MNAKSNHWCVVGGGMMGLTLAYRLAQHGQKVTVLEAGPEIGGLANTWDFVVKEQGGAKELGGVTWDRHYHVTLLSDLRLRNLLTELELEESMRWVETKTGFFTDGKLYSMSNSLEFLKFPPLNLIEKFRLGLTIFAASKIKNWKPLEQRFVADWLRQWSGEGTFKKIWLPLLQAKLGHTYKQVSAVFIWATIARMYRARQSGLKKEMFGYVPGGYAKILATFAEKLQGMGVEIKTSQPVKQVVAETEGPVRVDYKEQESQHFDRVVLTVPSPLISQVCPQLSQRERGRHEQIEYLGILCASVLLKRPLAKFYVTNITDPWVPFTAVIEMTTLVDPSELGGNHLVYLPRYVDTEDPAWQWSDEELEEKFLSALERMYPDFNREEVLAFRVSRVKRVMALPTLGYSEHLPSIATSIENVFAVNSAQIVQGTLNVNEVIEIAENALRDHLLPSVNSNPTNHQTARAHVETASELVARS